MAAVKNLNCQFYEANRTFVYVWCGYYILEYGDLLLFILSNFPSSII